MEKTNYKNHFLKIFKYFLSSLNIKILTKTRSFITQFKGNFLTKNVPKKIKKTKLEQQSIKNINMNSFKSKTKQFYEVFFYVQFKKKIIPVFSKMEYQKIEKKQ